MCRVLWLLQIGGNIETLRGKNPREIHGALSEVCGEFTVDLTTVSRWANRFYGGCVNKIMTQEQEGWEHQQMKEVWSLLHMLLKKTVVQNVKNFLEPREQKLRRKFRKNRSQLLVAGPFILQDNARPHKTEVVTDELQDYGWEVLPHAPYSPDTCPQEFYLFLKLKECMRGRCFSSLEELSTDSTRAIRHMNNNASQTLGLGHCEAGRLHWRIVNR